MYDDNTPNIDTFVGDTAPTAGFQLMRGLEPVDLTGATVTFRIFNPETEEEVNLGHQSCIVDLDPTSGKVSYAWGENDKPLENVYRGYLVAHYGSGQKETGAVRITVRPVGY